MIDHDIPLEDDSRAGFAFDYASSRTIDVDGRLHVADCKISAARVNDYMGSEIPGGDALGLDPGKLYRLYRDAAALRASAPTFENMPLMSHHVAVSANDPQKWLVVGAVSNVRWKAPFLVADLAIWDADAIARVRDGSKREISCGYRYRPDMTPGKVNGEAFDGRMLDIAANHVALVELGRVGPDCMVADSAPGVPLHVAFPQWNRLSRRQ
jgi:hypothetical protein